MKIYKKHITFSLSDKSVCSHTASKVETRKLTKKLMIILYDGFQDTFFKIFELPNFLSKYFSRGMVIFVTRWLMLSSPTIFVEKLYKILKILDKSNCIVNFRSMSKRLAQQTVRKAVSKRLGIRFKSCDGKGIFLKMNFFGKYLAKSTG